MAPSNDFPSHSKNIPSPYRVLQGSGRPVVEGLESQKGDGGNSEIVNSKKTLTN